MKGVGFRVQGVGCRVWGVGCRVEGEGLKVEGDVPDSRARVSHARVLASFTAT